MTPTPLAAACPQARPIVPSADSITPVDDLVHTVLSARRANVVVDYDQLLRAARRHGILLTHLPKPTRVRTALPGSPIHLRLIALGPREWAGLLAAFAR